MSDVEDFKQWSRPNLEKLAADLNNDNQRLLREIDFLKGQLRDALDAYRRLVVLAGPPKENHDA